MSIPSISSDGVITRIDYDSGDDPIYIGEAQPGTSTSINFWRVKKLGYDADGSVTSILWANKEAITFTVNWDDRTTHSYS